MLQTDQLKEFLGCDDEFLMQLMEAFLKESGDGVTRLKSAASDSNWPLVKATSHKMLSSTRIFDIGDLSTLLEEIEKMASIGTEGEAIKGKISLVEKSWIKVAEEIEALILHNKNTL